MTTDREIALEVVIAALLRPLGTIRTKYYSALRGWLWTGQLEAFTAKQQPILLSERFPGTETLLHSTLNMTSKRISSHTKCGRRGPCHLLIRLKAPAGVFL